MLYKYYFYEQTILFCICKKMTCYIPFCIRILIMFLTENPPSNETFSCPFKIKLYYQCTSNNFLNFYLTKSANSPRPHSPKKAPKPNQQPPQNIKVISYKYKYSKHKNATQSTGKSVRKLLCHTFSFMLKLLKSTSSFLRSTHYLSLLPALGHVSPQSKHTYYILRDYIFS